MWFRKKKPKEPKCLHLWVLSDLDTDYINAGVEVIPEDVYVLYCISCRKTRRVDEFEFRRLHQHGLIAKI